MALLTNRFSRRAILASLLLAVTLAGGLFASCTSTGVRTAASPTAVAQVALPPGTVTPVFVPVANVAVATRRATPTGLPPVVPPPSPSTYFEAWQAKIEIVWPHEDADLRDAQLANVTAYLTTVGNNPPPCDATPTVRLWRALNTEPARPVAEGTKRMVAAGGHTYPVWDFNDVDVSDARNAANRLLFFVTVDDVPVRHNVWVHGADARTVFPQADVPAAVTNERPRAVDARIEILWPHDDLPREQARLANITAYLFDPASGRVLGRDVPWSPRVRLHWSLNNDADQGVSSSRLGVARPVTGTNGLRFQAWDFNDIDISAARDSLNKQHFWVTIDDVPTFPNVWTHGASAPTIYPQTDVLAACQ